jgi:small subunit ribosomal protein S4
MKRYKSKTERRYGQNLQIKGERGLSAKAAFLRRPFAPGLAGKKGGFRRRVSEYGNQLAEKQKLRITYGLKERQFRSIVAKAVASPEQTDVAIMQLLERRLDNVIMRMGLAESRAQARQIVVHCHVQVNGRKNNVPSHLVRKDDIVSIKEKFKSSGLMKEIEPKLKEFNPPSWIAMDKGKLEGKIIKLPEGRDLEIAVDLPQVIEFYSR